MLISSENALQVGMSAESSHQSEVVKGVNKQLKFLLVESIPTYRKPEAPSRTQLDNHRLAREVGVIIFFPDSYSCQSDLFC